MPLNCFKNSGSTSPVNDRRHSKELEKKIGTWMKEYKKAIKLLLLGAGESGKTTIIKQMKILHMERGFGQAEREEKRREIRMNILEALQELIEIIRALQTTIKLQNPESQASFDFIRNIDRNTFNNWNDEFYDHAAALWADPRVQEFFKQAHEYPIIDSARYFLCKIDEIRKLDYMPSDQDILHSRKRTTDIQKIEFSVKIPKQYGGGEQIFWMFDVGGQRGERKKWIQVFEGITAILFLVASSNFDMCIREDYETNALKESLDLFEQIWTSRFLRDAGFILFLNKQDILEEKVNGGISIAKYFPDYQKYQLNNKEEGDRNSEYIKTRCFIRDKFLTVVKKQTEEASHYESANFGEPKKDRKCYWHFTIATDTNNIKRVFDDVHSMIVLINLGNFALA